MSLIEAAGPMGDSGEETMAFLGEGGAASDAPVGDGEPPGRNGMGDIPIPVLALIGHTSAALYLEPDGQGSLRFTAARAALHDDIVRNFTRGIPKSQLATVYMLGGGPAAGKSTMLASGNLKIPTGGKAAVSVNPDEFKELLPEYQQRVKDGDLTAAAFVHEESSYLAKRILRAAIENGQDVVHDGVGVNYERVIEEARPRGYTIRGYYAYLPDPEIAVKRAAERAKKTGRAVPESYIRERHRKISQIFPDAAKKLNSVELYDTSSEARLVAYGDNGALKILDAAAYEVFLKIGRDEPWA